MPLRKLQLTFGLSNNNQLPKYQPGVMMTARVKSGQKLITLRGDSESEQMIFIISLDYAQGVDIYLSLALLILSLIYLGYPRPFAFGKTGILLDGKTIVNDRILKAKKTDNGGKIYIEWYGWLMEKELPDCQVTDAILEEFSN